MGFEVHIEKTLLRPERGQAFHLRIEFKTQSRCVVIHGPSGAGKSLALQCLAGLIQPDAGRISFKGRALFDSKQRLAVPARHRNFGYLFQDYALMPHLNVRQNIAFGLQTGWRNPQRLVADEATEHWLQVFDLRAVALQMPHTLSGGQRQRTALARALAGKPHALLLDEPFSALDPDLRQHMRAEVGALLQQLDIPVLLITHDPEDRSWFGEQVIELRNGAVVQNTSANGLR